MAEYYTMKIAGLERRLEKFPVNEKMDIAAFIIFGDVELTIAGCEELRKKLLGGGQAEVALFDHLDKVVHEADEHAQKRYQHQRQGKIPSAVPGIKGHDEQRDHARDRREHQPAHRGRALLGAVTLGAQLIDGLSKLELAQHRQDPRSDQQHGHLGGNQRQNQPKHVPSTPWYVHARISASSSRTSSRTPRTLSRTGSTSVSSSR